MENLKTYAVVLALLAPTGAGAEIPRTPIEDGAIFSGNFQGRIPHNERQLWANMLADAVRDKGHTCKTVSSIRKVNPFIHGYHYEIGCNQLRAFYEVDINGWKVTPQ